MQAPDCNQRFEQKGKGDLSACLMIDWHVSRPVGQQVSVGPVRR